MDVDGPRVTMGQIEAGADRAANVLSVSSAIRVGAQVGTDLVVLPEYSSQFNPQGVGIAEAEPLDGPFVTAVRQVARAAKVAVIVGTTVPGSHAGKAANVVIAVAADGTVTGTYRKVHLYDAFGGRESDRLEAGDPAQPPLVFPLGSLMVGVMTCYDLRFSESARRLVDAGANVLVVPAAWAAGPDKVEHWRILAQARAIENTCTVVAVGMAGRGVIGHSLIVGPDGRIHLECDARPQVRTVTIDAAGIRATRELAPFLAHRRYGVVPR